MACGRFDVSGFYHGRVALSCACAVSACTSGKARRGMGVEQPAAEEPSGHRLLQWVVPHLDGTCGRGLQPVDLTGVFWRLCGMGGLACCTPDTVKHAGQSRAEGRGPAAGAVVSAWRWLLRSRVQNGHRDAGKPRRRPWPAPPTGGEQADEAGGEEELSANKGPAAQLNCASAVRLSPPFRMLGPLGGGSIRCLLNPSARPAHRMCC